MSPSRPRGRPPSPDLLTPAEWQIVNAVRHGMNNRVIAERRGVTLDAVKYHISNALQKLGFTTRKQLRTWAGVAMDSALYIKDTTMPDAKLGPIGQIARSTRDIAAARTWYADVLGLKHLYSFGDLAFFDCDGVRLFLSQNEKPADSESILYFRVADIHAACESLTAHGVAFTHAPHMIHRHADGTEEWMAFFTDNDGRPLAIMSQTPPS